MKQKLAAVLLFCFLFLVPTAHSADLNQFFSEQGKNWKIVRSADGSIRSLYGLGQKISFSSEAAVQEFLANYHPLFGIDRISDLRLASVDRTEEGNTYEFQQFYKGLPVVNGNFSIHLDRNNRIIAATAEYKKGLSGEIELGNTFPIARKTVEAFGAGKASSTTQLMVLNTGDHMARPVWRIELEPTELYKGSWIAFVDAERPYIVYSMFPTFADFEGTGNVWEQNPVVTQERSLQTFVKMDGSKKLFGTSVRVYDANSNHAVPFEPIDLTTFTTAEDPNRIYDYPEGDARLTEAMAYFHINQAHEYFRSLGARNINGKMPVFVNVAVRDGSRGYDNAFYSRSSQFRKTGILVFGAGSVLQNFGLDSDVYYHEYGHYVLDKARPGFFLSVENGYPGAFHEAFGDIADAAMTGNPKLAEFALRIKRTHKFIGRNVDNHNRFPEDVIHPRLHFTEPHHAGLIIGGAWWDLYEKIGADAHKILLKSLRLLPPTEMNFFDLRDAMIATDRNLFNGKNTTAITDSFANHGISGTDPGQPGTINALAVRTVRVNFQNGKRSLRSKFKKGDLIQVSLSYQGSSNLTPAYNIIPVDVSLSGGNCPECILILELPDEARQGKHTDLNGAIQAFLFTENASPGKYTLSVRSRLGGTDQITPPETANFTIQ